MRRSLARSNMVACEVWRFGSKEEKWTSERVASVRKPSRREKEASSGLQGAAIVALSLAEHDRCLTQPSEESRGRLNGVADFFSHGLEVGMSLSGPGLSFTVFFEVQCSRSPQSNAVSHIQSVNEMIMPDSWRLCLLEFLDSFVNAELLLLDKIAANKEAGSVVAVMAVNANGLVGLTIRLHLNSKAIDKGNEATYFGHCWRNFRDCRELMVVYTAFFHCLSVVDGRIMADVDDSIDLVFPLRNKLLRRMDVVLLP